MILKKPKNPQEKIQHSNSCQELSWLINTGRQTMEWAWLL